LATQTSTLERPTTSTTGSAVRVTVAAGLALLGTYLVFVLTKAGQSVDAKAVSHLSDSLQAGGSVEAWLRDVTVAATAAALLSRIVSVWGPALPGWVALVTLRRGWIRDDARHKKIAKVTLPLWLFVSVTGVVVYLMLYR
jgi:hypothetical protein